jgi:glycosyltransferase involved in cell wall biosynthesis
MAHEGCPLASADAGAAPTGRRIKVLYVCTALDRGSGGERRPLTLAKHLDRSRFGFAVCVIERASESATLELERSDCPLYSLNLSRRLYNPFSSIRILYRLYQLFSRIKPDVVQSHALHANLFARPAAKWAGVRSIVSTENVLPDVERDRLRRALNAPLHALNKLLDRSTDGIVAASEYVRRWKDPGGRSQKIRVIAPPLDLDAFTSAAASSQSRPVRKRGAPVLGVVGRLSREKGHRFLIAAMPEIVAQEPEAQLLVVGAGPLEAELRAQVEAFGLAKRVRFLGHLQDVRTAYSRMDMLVVPSLSEAFPLVALEGMVMELPIVGAAAGGISEIILDGVTGLLVPPGDSAALGRACRYLLGHPDVGREMGQRGRRRVLDEFHPTQFIARHEELYASVVEGKLCGNACVVS